MEKAAGVVNQALGERLVNEIDPPIVSYISAVVGLDTELFARDLESLVTTIGPLLESFVATEQQVRSICSRIQQNVRVVFNITVDENETTSITDGPQKLRKGAFRIGDTEDSGKTDMIKSIRGEWRPENIAFRMSDKERKAMEARDAQKRERRDMKEDADTAAERSAKLQAIETVQSDVHLRINMPPPPETSRDVRVEGFTVSFGKSDLLQDATLMLYSGVRYGLIGKNGVGKSTLLKHIAARDLPVPSSMKIVYVAQEVDASDTSALNKVIEADEERLYLLALEQQLLHKATPDDKAILERFGPQYSYMSDWTLEQVYTQLAEISADSAEGRASSILAGLQFTQEMQRMPTRSLSGGWRMRIALARALFCEPDLLLLDEPTNHLDINACVWLENYLTKWKNTLLVVSHNRDFLNNVVQQIVYYHHLKLETYKGNYDAFEAVRAGKMISQTRAYDKQQAERAHMQKFVDKLRFKTATAAMAQSRIKKLQKMDMIEKVVEDGDTRLAFPNPEPLSTPDSVMTFYDVTFGYEPSRVLFEHLQFVIPLRCRIALVGPNGVGKSTLLNLFSGDLEPLKGSVSRVGKLRMAHFSQHSVDSIKDLTQNCVEYFRKLFPGTPPEAVRAHLGKFGLSGESTLLSIGLLSGGQRSRLVLARMAWREPHIYLLDEPTNHLDIETVDALIRALNEFEGGVILVSHDERLISLVADELWVCNRDKTVKLFEGDFEAYRKLIIEKAAEL